MKNRMFLYICISTLIASGATVVFAKEKISEPKVIGSLLVNGARPSDFPKLAKISSAEATKIAVSQTPGSILSVGLENEDGFLIYAVQVANEKTGHHEVIVDAGNGRVISSSAKKAGAESDEDDEREED